MAYMKVKVCFCGKMLNRHTGVWIPADKHQQETLKDRVAKGEVEIERICCNQCQKKEKKKND